MVTYDSYYELGRVVRHPFLPFIIILNSPSPQSTAQHNIHEPLPFYELKLKVIASMTTFSLYSNSLSSTILPLSSHSNNSIFCSPFKVKTNQFRFTKTTLLQLHSRLFLCSSSPQDAGSGDITPNNFCIIEGPEMVQDFVQMQLQEIQDNIKSRRNKIFLLMEEVRRLRVQQRLRSVEKAFIQEGEEEADEMPEIPSSIPFLPHVTPNTLKKLYLTGISFISAIIVFGALIAPMLELKLGLGGTSYEDFIRSMHLPLQLSQVDPIVASFSGGAVGVISVLMLIEANNVEQQEKTRCKYCLGTGYLACARCSSSGVCLDIDPISVSDASVRPLQVPTTRRCPNCSGAGKVMCPTCLCTGMKMASEHDLRIDPFD